MNSSENQVKRLTVDDIEVPAGMLDAYVQAGLHAGFQITLGQMDNRRKCFAAALLWLAENPIVPSDEQSGDLHNKSGMSHREVCEQCRNIATEWQRRMFLSKQDALPDEVKSLLLDESPLISEHSRPTRPFYNSAVLEAYKLGKEGK